MLENDHIPDATWRVAVPATSGNLGAGFDVLGLALRLYNVFTVRRAAETRIEIDGQAGVMPLDHSNLFYRAFAHLYARYERPAPPLLVRMELAVPSGSGLGSSATAVVGGLLAANAMLGEPLSREQLLAHAVELEHGRHADNVAPALLGGLVVNVAEGEQVISLRLPFPEDLRAVLFTPDFAMDTVQGRMLMPGRYSCSDTVFNVSRAALFVAAVTQRHYGLLRVAMQDRMHQPYRAQIFPLLPTLIEGALAAGAWGAALSGGGSSILALASERAGDVAAALREVAADAGMAGISRVLEIDPGGAVISREQRDMEGAA